MSEPTIYACLASVMADLTSIGKGDTNKEQGYAYRGLDLVLVAVAPVLRAHRLIVVPVVEGCEYAQVEIGRNKTAMTVCRVTVAYRWYGPAGDFVESRVAAEAMDTADKSTAKAMAAAWRTALLQTLALPVQDAHGITDAQLRTVMLLSKRLGLTDRADRLAYASAAIGREIESAKDLSITEAGLLIDSLQMAETDTHEEMPS
jgi:hypothetical protein